MSLKELEGKRLMSNYNLINKAHTFKALGDWHPRNAQTQIFRHNNFVEEFKIGNLSFGSITGIQTSIDSHTLEEWNVLNKKENPALIQDEIFSSILFLNLVDNGTYSYWQAMRKDNRIELFQLVTIDGEIPHQEFENIGDYFFHA